MTGSDFCHLVIAVGDGLPIILDPPPYPHGEVIIRNNIIKMVDGQTDPAFGAWGIFVPGAKRVVVEDNIVDVTNANPIREWRSGTVRLFNNRTAAGALIQGVNGNSLIKRSELPVEIEDATLLSI